ncbi:MULTISPECIES: hypothetical protein [Streptomyces]|uniref:CsbD family protein n=1 Tax=Streptomyces alboflavus TaxID=67267 RepID=A0A1Z1WPH4_9ACTN|nr:hypothetical protein [Streptomyces alboflavus]ARX88337.1 hypothetical protein SMD44_07824 [Streptomyces alboflavus]
MGWMKAAFKRVLGRKKEADGIALGDERLRAEGQREKQRQSHDGRAAGRGTGGNGGHGGRKDR